MWEQYKAEEEQIKAPDFLKSQILEQMNAYDAGVPNGNTPNVQPSSSSPMPRTVVITCLILMLINLILFVIILLRDSRCDCEVILVADQCPSEVNHEPLIICPEGMACQELEDGYVLVCPTGESSTEEVDSDDEQADHREGREIIITPPVE